MFIGASHFAALAMSDAFVIGGIAVAVLAALIVSFVFFQFGTLWIQDYTSGADIRIVSLIGMRF